jgi:alpha-1,3-rhamnosyl/mannosyltransferase
MLPRSVRDRYPLVLAGGKGWRNEQLKERVAKATREGWLRHLGFVEEDVLPALYAGAALFVYPSMYEGFGLPPLEAMASGVPVVVSYASCLPEVCGDAALYVDPSDVVGFARVLETILNDPEHRAHLSKKSVARSHLFGWDRCIQGTVSAYQQAIARIGAV